MEKIKLVIIDNLEEVEAYSEKLSGIEDFMIVGKYADGQEGQHKVKEWENDQVFVPLVFQVVKGKISNAFCGFMAAKYLRYMYILNFFDSYIGSQVKSMPSFR